MDKIALKRQIAQGCRAALMESIEQTELDMDNLRTSAKDDKDSAGGFSDRIESIDEQMIEDLRNREEHFNFLKEELRIMNEINWEHEHQQIGQGSVVITDSLHFLIAISREFTLNGQTYHSISTNSPIYKAMEGKKAGDEFSFRDKNYKIQEVF